VHASLRSILITVSLALPGAAAAGPLEDAVAAYERQDYAAVLQILLPLATQADATGPFTPIFIIPVLIGLFPAAIARLKGRSFVLWWMYGATLFVVALPHALLLRRAASLEKRAFSDGLKKCPYCAEMVRKEAIVCKHCGRDFAP
jgi:hypothetical protein